MNDQPDNSHHHGNLREALIVAGIELLETGGPAALSLRKCAALAGVSHAAPANHFKGLLSLKVAIVARGHKIFAARMRLSQEQAEPSPRAQLVAICDGYIAFAKEHRALFQFMFQFFGEQLSEVDEISMREKQENAEASYDILRQACLPFNRSQSDGLNTETMVWSLVHGYAVLFADGCSHTSPAPAIPAFAELLPELVEK